LIVKKISKIDCIQAIAFVFIAIYIISTSSCANQGVGPTGGPKDTIPPVVVNTSPLNREINYTQNQLSLDFDEYVVADNLSGKMVISPPLAEKPTVKIKGKSVTIKINEDLVPGRTYSVDFKDGIKDYNEGNKLENLRLLFSTYDKLDTLRISGYLLDAFSFEPVENATATIYTIDDDSVFSTLRPDFIARADEKGFFMFDNLPEGKYKLYGLVDGDNNLKFNQEMEKIAFIDSFIIPSANFINKTDTIIKEKDTIVSAGYTEYSPDDIFGRLFLMDYFSQAVTSFKRTERYKMEFTFRESLTDSFKLNMISADSIENWGYTEINKNRDSLSVWLTDTTLINNDSLFVSLNYTVLDSTDEYITVTDTLKLFYTQPKQMGSKKGKAEALKMNNFDFSSSISSSNFDLNREMIIEAPIPIEALPKEKISVFEVVDTLKVPVVFKSSQVEGSQRKIKIDFTLKESATYKIRIDSAAVNSLSGLTNNAFELIFKTQKLEFYGILNFEFTGITSNGIIQLLKNSKEEEIEREIEMKNGTKTVSFDYLKPGKYKAKFIADINGNGKWDTGNIDTKTQPEPVHYYSKIISVRSNWETKENWSIDSKFQRKAIEENKEE